MNGRMIVYIIGKILGVEAAVMVVPSLVGAFYGEESARYFLVVAAILFWIYALTGTKKPEKSVIYGKDGLFLVAATWVLWSVFGALPPYLSGVIPDYLDAFFETVSDFTTTGSTILTDIEALPRCMNFWRAFTQWIGGMGVLIFVMVLISLEDKHSMYLIRAEVPGPQASKLLPKARQSAKLLYFMYFVLTLLAAICFKVGGMSLFDSVIHAMSTASTGGVSNYNDSIGHFNSSYIEVVSTIFIILFGINFDIFFLLVLGKFKAVFKNEELRYYLFIIAATIGIVWWNVHSMYENPLISLGHAAFQVVSMITTTGFVSVDFNLWPQLSQGILLVLMVIGACSGSTGGGMKVSRWIILTRSIKNEIIHVLHPKSVNTIKVSEKRVSSETLRSIYIYFVAYVMILIGSVLLVSLDNYDFTVNYSAVLATMNNVGPGLDAVGPVGNYSHFSPLSKLVFCFDMLVGRLEIFPFLMLFSPLLWRRKF